RRRNTSSQIQHVAHSPFSISSLALTVFIFRSCLLVPVGAASDRSLHKAPFWPYLTRSWWRGAERGPVSARPPLPFSPTWRGRLERSCASAHGGWARPGHGREPYAQRSRYAAHVR